MYLGNHAVTILKLPDKRRIVSRDYHTNIFTADTIELDHSEHYIVIAASYIDSGLGNIESQFHYEHNIILDTPAYVCELTLESIKLETVLAQFDYASGLALRNGESDDLPPLTKWINITNFIPDPFRECYALEREMRDRLEGKLSLWNQRLASQSIVFITVTSPKNDVKTYGTGFFVNPYGYIVTSGHIFWQRDDVEGELINFNELEVTVRIFALNQPKKIHKAEIISARGANWDEPDLAFIKLNISGNNFLCLSHEEPSVFDSIVAAGFPEPDEARPILSFRRGEVTALSRSELTQTNVLEHSAGYDRGMSGGPVVSMHCDIIGVNDEVKGELRQTRCAIASSTLQPKLNEHTAKGHGPYFGASRTERFRITVAQISLMWSEIDAKLATVTLNLADAGFGSGKNLERSKIELVYSCLTALESLHQVLVHLKSTFEMQRSFRELLKGFATQIKSLEQIIAMAVKHQSSQYTIVKDRLFSEEIYGSDTINSIQDGRTKITFATNEIIGRTWLMNKQNALPATPFTIELNIQARDVSTATNILGNTFQRHRGERIAYISFITNLGSKREVYDRSTVSGSVRMIEEIKNVLQNSSINGRVMEIAELKFY